MIARLLIGASDTRLKEIETLLEQVGLKNPHPDLLYLPSESKLGVEQARKIKDHFSLKPYSAKGRAVVLEEGGNLTDEAQNALLKTLEELPTAALFILGADSDSKFLPTILSRCQVSHLDSLTKSNVEQLDNQDIEKLINSSIPERFEYIEKLKDKGEFLHSLLNFFHKKLPLNATYVEELLTAERWQKQNVNIRAILEYLMLKMPQL